MYINMGIVAKIIRLPSYISRRQAYIDREAMLSY